MAEAGDRPGRRARRREETLAEIKVTALRQLAAGGPTAVSMRGIARAMDATASAVHYYFPDREALLDALVVDSYLDLAAAAAGAHRAARAVGSTEPWTAVAGAHRRWALDHPERYLLAYGPVGAATRLRVPAAGRAMWSVVTVLFDCMRDCLARGDLDLGGIDALLPPALAEDLEQWRTSADGIADLPVGALAACLLNYSRLHGAITLELIGHLPPAVTARGDLFDVLVEASSRRLA